MTICRGFLPWELSVAICHENLPWVCFVYASKPFFCVGISFLFESKPFLYVNKIFFIYKNFFFNSVSFCFCRDSYGPPYKKENIFRKGIRNSDLTKSLEKRRRWKWSKFPHHKVTMQKKEMLISDLVEGASCQHKSNSKNRISSSRKNKLRGRWYLKKYKIKKPEKVRLNLVVLSLIEQWG